MLWRRGSATFIAAVLAAAIFGCGTATTGHGKRAASGAASPAAVNAKTAVSGIHKIKHVVVIMQENRSFDSYFGTYPGADGIPMKNGRPTACLSGPGIKTCQRPFHDR